MFLGVAGEFCWYRIQVTIQFSIVIGQFIGTYLSLVLEWVSVQLTSFKWDGFMGIISNIKLSGFTRYFLSFIIILKLI